LSTLEYDVSVIASLCLLPHLNFFYNNYLLSETILQTLNQQNLTFGFVSPYLIA